MDFRGVAGEVRLLCICAFSYAFLKPHPSRWNSLPHRRPTSSLSEERRRSINRPRAQDFEFLPNNLIQKTYRRVREPELGDPMPCPARRRRFRAFGVYPPRRARLSCHYSEFRLLSSEFSLVPAPPPRLESILDLPSSIL